METLIKKINRSLKIVRNRQTKFRALARAKRIVDTDEREMEYEYIIETLTEARTELESKTQSNV